MWCDTKPVHFLPVVYKMYFKWLLEHDHNHPKAECMEHHSKPNGIWNSQCTIQLPWRVNAMVNLSGLMAVVFLWWFRLQVVPLLFYPSCVTHLRKIFHVGIEQKIEKNWTKEIKPQTLGPVMWSFHRKPIKHICLLNQQMLSLCGLQINNKHRTYIEHYFVTRTEKSE